MKPFSSLCHFLLLLPLASPQQPGDVVDLAPPAGPVRGRVSLVGDGTQQTAREFLGIPFAQPPLGELRFRPPQPMPVWSDVRPALHLPNTCPQLDMGELMGNHLWNINTNVSEDCLYLNVWTPSPPTQTPLAVLVWIYGGGYTMGSSTTMFYDGKVLATYNNIIVVSMQYRVGALGFLTTGADTTAPGNVGLLDQQLAIKWVKENIQVFGGDPEKITLFGESAGGGSVNFHLISKDSRNYFTRAIMQSGHVLAPWSSYTPDVAMASAKTLSTSLGCPADDNDLESTLLCLRGKPASDFISSGDQTDPVFGPVSYDINFLKSSIQEIIETKSYYKTEILLGANSDEGSVFISNFFENPDDPHLDSATFRPYLESFLAIIGGLNPIQVDMVEYLYMDWDHPNDSSRLLHGLVQAVGDQWFLCPMSEWAQLYADDNADTYTYLFTQRVDMLNFTQPAWMGVAHGEEIYFVFGVPLQTGFSNSDTDKEFSRLVMTYWTNFAKTGNPNIGTNMLWQKRTPGSTEFFTLSAVEDNRVMGLGPKNNYCAFWNQILPSLSNATTERDPVEQQHCSGASTCPMVLVLALTVVLSFVRL